MAIGTTPIIPLYRVQPDPNARFERFGLNDSQLFGKPLLETAFQSQPTQSQLAAARRATTKVQAQETSAGLREFGQSQSTVQTASNLSSGYSGRGEHLSETKPGSSLNLLA
jgi:hypothetical protein